MFRFRISFLLFLIPILLSGQQTLIDSLKRTVHNAEDSLKIQTIWQIAKEYKKNNYDSAIKYYDTGIKLANKLGYNCDVANMIMQKAQTFAHKGKYHMALDTMKHAFLIFNKINDTEGISTALNNIGTVYFNLSEYDSCRYYWTKSLAIVIKENDSSGIATAYANLGILAYVQDNSKDALELFAKSLKLREAINDKNGLSSIYMKVALIYSEKMNESEKAIPFLEKALKIVDETGDITRKTKILINLSNAYRDVGKPGDSRDKIIEALELSKQIGNERLMAHCFIHFGSDYIRNKGYKLAIVNYEKALEIYEKLGRKRETGETYYKIGLTYFEMNEYSKSITYFTRFIDLSRSLELLNLRTEAYGYLAKASAALNNYKKAYDFLQERNLLADSISKLNNISQLKEYEARFANEQNEKKIELLEQKERIHQEKLKRTEIIRNFSILIVVIMITLSIFVYHRFRQKKRLNNELRIKNREIKEKNIQIEKQADDLKQYNRILEEKNNQIDQKNIQLLESNNTKNRLFSIIGHDLRTPFNNIKTSLDLLSKKTISKERDEHIKSLMIKDVSYGLSLLENLLMWAKTQGNEVKYSPGQNSVNEIITKTIGFLNNSATNKDISINFYPKEVYFGYFDRNMITTVVRNLLSNAIKFTNNNGQIDIQVKRKSRQIEVCICDNGVGMTEETIQNLLSKKSHYSTRGTNNEKGSGLGLNICNEFVQTNLGSLHISSKPGTGTTVTITLPGHI